MTRFYRQAAAAPAPGGHAVALDGRIAKTPGKRDLVVPSAALAAALAEEWNAQGDKVDARTMPLTRLAAATIDRPADKRATILREVANYAGTDLLCYRAAGPPPLAARQQQMWEPLLDWAALRYDAPLAVTAGVIPKPQPAASLAAFAAVIAGLDDFTLTAMHVATGACGSLILALALHEGRLDAEAAFTASQLDESFQIEAWGEDAEAAERRRRIAADIADAARFMHLLRA
jgi:chaperone required for assembly of F1-ATPase